MVIRAIRPAMRIAKIGDHRPNSVPLRRPNICCIATHFPSPLTGSQFHQSPHVYFKAAKNEFGPQKMISMENSDIYGSILEGFS